MAIFPNIETLKETGSVFRFGTGIMGKTAIVICVTELGLFGTAISLHSDWMKFVSIMVGVSLFLAWYLRLIAFANNHPETVLLEGAQYIELRRLQMGVKGHKPSLEEMIPQLAPESLSAASIPEKQSQEPIDE